MRTVGGRGAYVCRKVSCITGFYTLAYVLVVQMKYSCVRPKTPIKFTDTPLKPYDRRTAAVFQT